MRPTKEMLETREYEFWTEEHMHLFKCWKMMHTEAEGGPTVVEQAGVDEWVIDRIDKSENAMFEPGNIRWIMPNPSDGIVKTSEGKPVFLN